MKDPGTFQPLSSSVRVQFGARSHTGASRPRNEDHYMVILTQLTRDSTPEQHLSDVKRPADAAERGYRKEVQWIAGLAS